MAREWPRNLVVAIGGVYLRPAQADDEALIHKLLCVPAVYQFLADGVEPPPSITRDWIRSAADQARMGGGLWVLDNPAIAEIGGLVRLAAEGDTDTELELVYVLHPQYWGAGVATRMAHTALGLAFRAGQVSAVWAGAMSRMRHRSGSWSGSV